jgi:hypothetical protein
MEGAGKAGRATHPQPRMQKVESIRVSHHRFAGTSGLPRAVVLTVSFALSSETGLCCLRHRQRLFADLAPASGRQDHTTSPSAFEPLVLRHCRVHRISPNVRDDGQRPSLGRDGRSSRRDLPDALSEIFSRSRLDRLNTKPTDLPVGQIRARARSIPALVSIDHAVSIPAGTRLANPPETLWCASGVDLTLATMSPSPSPGLRKLDITKCSFLSFLAQSCSFGRP